MTSSWANAWLASRAAAGALAALALVTARAQTHQVRQGEFTLRSSTVVSTRIDPAAARVHGIEPAGHRAVLNVTVLRSSAAGAEVPVSARVTAQRRDLAGIGQPIPMRKVEENGRVSYTGVYDFLPHEVLDFTIRAVPQDAPRSELRLTYRDRLSAAAQAR